MAKIRRQATANEAAADVIRRWRESIEICSGEAIAVGWNRKLFRLMRDVFDVNVALAHWGGFLFQWMALNHFTFVAMSLRRELDHWNPGNRTGSHRPVLKHLLHEIASRPEILTRAWFVSEWHGRDNYHVQRAHAAFDEFDLTRHPQNRDEDHISAKGVNNDLEHLERQTDKVREFVERTVAHRGEPPEGKVTWAELDAAVGTFDTYVKKYYLLLHQAGIVTEPRASYSLYVPLHRRWLKKGTVLPQKDE